MDGCERIDKRPWGMFYRGPTVGAKCSYQNLEPRHVRVDTGDVGSYTLHVDLEKIPLTRGGPTKQRTLTLT